MAAGTKTKRFRVAFSFAGEKREFVGTVAAILAQRFGEPAILYDKFHEAEFAKAQLGNCVSELYDESELVVVLICPDHVPGEWCGPEWDAVSDLLMRRREDEVILCGFGYATAEGTLCDVGLVDLDGKTPGQTATLILERLARSEGHPADHYTCGPRAAAGACRVAIPNNLPRLQPFFGREEELAAIREALDPENRSWGALIDGPGGIGKTSLAVRAACDCSPALFKRVIFVSAKQRELDDEGVRPLGPFVLTGLLEVLNELARELGQPEIAKSPEDQRIRLLHEALKDANALLVLDNLESLARDDRDQLFALVRRLPQGCKAILTCRRRIG